MQQLSINDLDIELAIVVHDYCYAMLDYQKTRLEYLVPLIHDLLDKMVVNCNKYGENLSNFATIVLTYVLMMNFSWETNKMQVDEAFMEMVVEMKKITGGSQA